MNVTPRPRTAFSIKVAKNTSFMLTLTRHEIHHAHEYEKSEPTCKVINRIFGKLDIIRGKSDILFITLHVGSLFYQQLFVFSYLFA